MTTLHQEIDRWEADLENIAETVAALRALTKVAVRFERAAAQ
ncbi:hypothetical protein [Kribbella sp. NPDC048928]